MVSLRIKQIVDALDMDNGDFDKYNDITSKKRPSAVLAVVVEGKKYLDRMILSVPRHLQGMNPGLQHRYK